MNKTLLDEFAMAALSGILVNSNYSPTDAAEEAYRYAEAMMAERAKRMPAERQQPHRAPTGEDASKSDQLDQFIAKNTGSRMTCSEIYQQCFNFREIPPRHWLVIIGGKLRTIGCEKVRSGGKDYYQL